MPEPGEPPDAEADPRKYLQLAALLRGRIQDGTLRPGDRAPSITVLAAEHGGWARGTCAKAFKMLETEGFMNRVPGLGYFVACPAGTAENRTPEPVGITP